MRYNYLLISIFFLEFLWAYDPGVEARFCYETPQQVIAMLREHALMVERYVPGSCERALQAIERYDFYVDEVIKDEVYLLLMRLVGYGYSPAYEKALYKTFFYYHYNDDRYDWITECLFLLVRAGYEPAFACALHRIEDIIRGDRGGVSVKYALFMAGILLEKRPLEMAGLHKEILQWLPSQRAIDHEDIRIGDLSYCVCLARSFSDEKDREFLFDTIQYYSDNVLSTDFEYLMVLRVVNNLLVRNAFEDYEWLYYFVENVFGELKELDDERREFLYEDLLFTLSFLIQKRLISSHHSVCYLAANVVMKVRDLHQIRMVRKNLLIDALRLMSRLVQEDFPSDVHLKNYVRLHVRVLIESYINDRDPDIRNVVGSLVYEFHVSSISSFIEEDRRLMNRGSGPSPQKA